MKISVQMSGKDVHEFRDGVEAILRQPAPSLNDDDRLTLNYSLALSPIDYRQIDALRSIVQMMQDEEIKVTADGLDSEVVSLYMEMGRLLQDMKFTYKGRDICGKIRDNAAR